MHIKLMKGKALRKHSLHEKTAASVLLKLFISSNEYPNILCWRVHPYELKLGVGVGELLLANTVGHSHSGISI